MRTNTNKIIHIYVYIYIYAPNIIRRYGVEY